MVPQEKLDQICARFAYLEAKMADGSAIDEIAKLSKEILLPMKHNTN